MYFAFLIRLILHRVWKWETTSLASRSVQ